MVIEKDIKTGNKIHTLPNGSVINSYTHVVKGADIGVNCMIGEHCYISKEAKIGHNTRIQNHVNVWDGVLIKDNVFIGPKVCFTNDRDPSEREFRELFEPDITVVDSNATICANATIISPVIIGEKSLIKAGALVIRDVAPRERVGGFVK